MPQYVWKYILQITESFVSIIKIYSNQSTVEKVLHLTADLPQSGSTKQKDPLCSSWLQFILVMQWFHSTEEIVLAKTNLIIKSTKAVVHFTKTYHLIFTNISQKLQKLIINITFSPVNFQKYHLNFTKLSSTFFDKQSAIQSQRLKIIVW